MASGNSEVRTIQSGRSAHISKWRIIWLDQNMDNNVQLYRQNIEELGRVCDSIKTLTDKDQCVSYISDHNNRKLILISSGKLGRTTVPHVHDMRQVNAIYLFCGDKSKHEEWAKGYSKIKGVFTCIKLVCNAVNETIQKDDEPILTMGFVSTSNDILNKSLDQLDQFFVCGEILKEVLSSIHFQQDSMAEFIQYCRKTPFDHQLQLENTTIFEKEYRSEKAINWYMASRFLSTMINRALCNFKIECIMRIGFFIRDLHENIVRLYTEQSPTRLKLPRFLMHRGQGLSKTDFHYLKNTQDGLISFIDFLLVYKDQKVALNVAQKSIEDPDTIGVLFVITIDPSISSTPFANIEKILTNEQGANILFSMHSTFRITNMRTIDANDRLWEVQLLTIDNKDPQLRLVTEHIQEEAYPHSKDWHRLGDTLIKLQQFDKAKKVFHLLAASEITAENADIHRKLGMITEKQEEYDRAVSYYKMSLEINQRIFPPTHSNLSTSYILLGRIYATVGDYQQATINLEAALKIQEQILPPYHPNLANTYRDLGETYYKWTDYIKAIAFHEKAYNIYKEILPDDNPDLATAAYKLADAYRRKERYPKALEWLEYAVKIGQSSGDPTLQKWQAELDSMKEKSNAK